jgi:hypothetical protein
MATTSKALFRGAAATSNTTLYTVPSATTTVVTDIVIANTAATDATFTLTLDSVDIATGTTVPANDSVSLSLKQVLAAADLIEGLASAVTVNFHISGVEIS